MPGDGFTITEHDPSTFTREEVGLGLDLQIEVSEEILPGEPHPPLDVAWAAHEATPARLRRFAFRAWAPDGTLIGTTGTQIDPDDNDNPDVLGCAVAVRAAHRRHGIATALLAYMVALARAEGRSRLIGPTFGPVPAGAAFATAVGAESKAASHMNHLPIAEVDRALMEQWVADGPARAADYELLVWDGRIPDANLEPFIDLVHVMNDAPRDDMDLNDFTMTPDQWREWEDQALAIGSERWTLVARRKSDGALAGFHDVNWAPHEPTTVYVGATGVRPEHRGHALGKWLKAAMTLRIIDERPAVDDIRTGNADSNDAMLGINHAMGYRPLIAEASWELQVDAAAARLEAAGVTIPTLTPR